MKIEITDQSVLNEYDSNIKKQDKKYKIFIISLMFFSFLGVYFNFNNLTTAIICCHYLWFTVVFFSWHVESLNTIKNFLLKDGFIISENNYIYEKNGEKYIYHDHKRLDNCFKIVLCEIL